MILYLDTSALVKICVEEKHRNSVHKAVSLAEVVASHALSFVEAHAAFARLAREKILNSDKHDLLKKVFQKTGKII
jgi:predicted nucleic acid-binding protein